MKEGLFEQLLLHLFENGLRDDSSMRTSMSHIVWRASLTP